VFPEKHLCRWKRCA